MIYNCFRVLAYNYADADLLANYYATSEQSAFPLENAFNRQRRSKLWRSAGHFEVTTSNNGIRFQEAALAPILTASIAVGSYDSIAAFAAAIKAAMQAAGVRTYTITQVNGKFRVQTSHTFLNLNLSDALFTAADLMGFAAVDRTGGTSYIADEIRAHDYERIVFDMGVPTNPEMFCLIGRRNEPLKIGPDAIVKLEGSYTNNWSSPAVSIPIAYDDEVLTYHKDGGIGSDAYRYWSIYIQNRQTPLLYVEVGSFFLGNYWNPQRGRVQFPLSNGLIDRSETVFSEGGQSYSDIREQTSEYSITWRHLQQQDVEEFRKIFETYGTARPLWFSMDTGEAFSTSLNRRLVFAKIASEPDIVLESPRNFTMSLNIREEL